MKMCGTGGDKKVLFLVSTFPSVKECVNWVHTHVQGLMSIGVHVPGMVEYYQGLHKSQSGTLHPWVI